MKNSDIRFLKALPSIIAALGMSSLFLNQWAYASDVGAELYEQHCAACQACRWRWMIFNVKSPINFFLIP
jgi:hypothetical protein